MDERRGQRNGKIVHGRTYWTGHVLCHHIIINMEIDGDIMDVILNNQIKSGCPRSMIMSKVGEVAGLNGSE